MPKVDCKNILLSIKKPLNNVYFFDNGFDFVIRSKPDEDVWTDFVDDVVRALRESGFETHPVQTDPIPCFVYCKENYDDLRWTIFYLASKRGDYLNFEDLRNFLDIKLLAENEGYPSSSVFVFRANDPDGVETKDFYVFTNIPKSKVKEAISNIKEIALLYED